MDISQDNVSQSGRIGYVPFRIRNSQINKIYTDDFLQEFTLVNDTPHLALKKFECFEIQSKCPATASGQPVIFDFYQYKLNDTEEDDTLIREQQIIARVNRVLDITYCPIPSILKVEKVVEYCNQSSAQEIYYSDEWHKRSPHLTFGEYNINRTRTGIITQHPQCIPVIKPKNPDNYWPNLQCDGILVFPYKAAYGIAAAVHYFHQRNIMLRILSPSIIFFDSENNPLVGGYFDAKSSDENTSGQTTFVPNTNFTAPDMSTEDARLSDIYSLGLLITYVFALQVLKGKTPDGKSTAFSEYNSSGKFLVKSKNIDGFSIDAYTDYLTTILKLPEPLCKILLQCAENNPTSRPKVVEIMEVIEKCGLTADFNSEEMKLFEDYVNAQKTAAKERLTVEDQYNRMLILGQSDDSNALFQSLQYMVTRAITGDDYLFDIEDSDPFLHLSDPNARKINYLLGRAYELRICRSGQCNIGKIPLTDEEWTKRATEYYSLLPPDDPNKNPALSRVQNRKNYIPCVLPAEPEGRLHLLDQARQLMAKCEQKTEDDHYKIISILRTLVEFNDPFATYELARYIEWQNPSQAFHLYNVAAQLGNVTAYRQIGRCYELGIGVPAPNQQLAYSMYMQGAAHKYYTQTIDSYCKRQAFRIASKLAISSDKLAISSDERAICDEYTAKRDKLQSELNNDQTFIVSKMHQELEGYVSTNQELEAHGKAPIKLPNPTVHSYLSSFDTCYEKVLIQMAEHVKLAQGNSPDDQNDPNDPNHCAGYFIHMANVHGKTFETDRVGEICGLICAALSNLQRVSNQTEHGAIFERIQHYLSIGTQLKDGLSYYRMGRDFERKNQYPTHFFRLSYLSYCFEGCDSYLRRCPMNQDHTKVTESQYFHYFEVWQTMRTIPRVNIAGKTETNLFMQIVVTSVSFRFATNDERFYMATKCHGKYLRNAIISRMTQKRMTNDNAREFYVRTILDAMIQILLCLKRNHPLKPANLPKFPPDKKMLAPHQVADQEKQDQLIYQQNQQRETDQRIFTYSMAAIRLIKPFRNRLPYAIDDLRRQYSTNEDKKEVLDFLAKHLLGTVEFLAIETFYKDVLQAEWEPVNIKYRPQVASQRTILL